MAFKILSFAERLALRQNLSHLSNEDICNRVAAYYPEVFLAIHAHSTLPFPPGHEPSELMQVFQLLISGDGQEAYRLFYNTKLTHKENRTRFELWKSQLREQGLLP